MHCKASSKSLGSPFRKIRVSSAKNEVLYSTLSMKIPTRGLCLNIIARILVANTNNAGDKDSHCLTPVVTSLTKKFVEEVIIDHAA